MSEQSENSILQSKKLLVMAGGTGGHVFPALAVAQLLIKQGWQVRWLGTADRMEAQLVPQYGIEIDFIKISGLRGKGLKALLMAPINIFKAVCQARKMIKAYNPDVVLGMGGYVSGPGGLAARLCGVPIVLHEQNGIAGLTNKWLAKFATKVLQAFPSAFKDAQVVGNPVRSDVIALPQPAVRFRDREGPIRVLVMGGSQGAQVLNTVMPTVFTQLSNQIVIWHQTGKGAQQKVLAAYAQADLMGSQVTEFIDDVAGAYGWADVIVCRSGALTVSEIEAAGVAAIFVPFMHKDRQQYWNAMPLQDAKAAEIIEQPDFTVEKVVNLLQKWDRDILLSMAEKARALAIIDATERVADVIKQVTKQVAK
ncbi:undecaprenyldiphospho-muramoylpentapeptide beta-N-acetylglucosaminyltransferase [Utexia brackfieldae]|uniref:undecaprenyldiphospho-muramoylpentapeptide beta-N-acetylglucosaminyltransferase n=1 Tax=Utexia brackfieldae TaxID=3074108 RepID=UPI00370D98D4